MKNKKIHTFLFWILLLVILISATLVRINRASWGLPYLYYWDEPQTASNALQMLKSGSLHPQFFGYGTLTIYINYIVNILHYIYLVGRPEGVQPFITSLGDIQTLWDTKWHWTISHPSFYFWNRVVNVAFGTGAVILVFLLTKKLFNKWAGLIAASFITSAAPHIEFSALITPDVPVTFFVLACVYFSFKFTINSKSSDLVISLIFTGMSIATKYNSALIIFVPLVAILCNCSTNKSEIKALWFLWFLIIPVFSFIVCMPFAFLDSTKFLTELGGEIRHYKVLGHGHNTSLPGLAHIHDQFQNFKTNIGIPSLMIAFSGLLGLVYKPRLVFVLIFPVIYFLYMTQMKVNFHRNFIVIYPFFGILYASAVWTFYHIVQNILPTFTKKILLSLISCILTIPIFLNYYQSFNSSLHIKNEVDSRSKFVSFLNNINDSKLIYIPDILRFHNDDLKKLKSHKIVSLETIFSCSQPLDDGYVLLPSNIQSMFKSPTDVNKIKQFSNKIKSINDSTIIKKMGLNSNPLFLDIYSINPEILLLNINQLNHC